MVLIEEVNAYLRTSGGPHSETPPRSIPTFLAAVDPCETASQMGCQGSLGLRGAAEVNVFRNAPELLMPSRTLLPQAAMKL